MGNVTLVSGPNRGSLRVNDGTTVADLRSRFSGAYEIAAQATVTVNGVIATNDTVVVDGDVVVFAKTTGEKGN